MADGNMNFETETAPDKLKDIIRGLVAENERRKASASREADLLAKASTRVKPLRAVGNFISSTLGMAESFMQETKIVQDFNLTTTVSLVACLQKDLEDAKSFDAKLKIREKIDSL